MRPETDERMEGAGWRISLYPDAREAAGLYVSVDPRLLGGQRGVPGEALDPARSARVAGSRARATVRRYCASNHLNRLGTLTYAGSGCHDPQALRANLSEFFRNLRSSLGGKPLPYLWVPEWHKTDHGLHAHFACGQYIKRSVIEEAWGRGFVHIKLLGDLPSGSSAVDEARRAGRYLAKYIDKDFGRDRSMGLHRYDRAQGFEPKKVVIHGSTYEHAYHQACTAMGGEQPERVSCSLDWPGWTGPYVVGLTWPS
jgi:hypothetical protein